MQLTRLRLSGFKSFVDPTELMIGTGLTGIVGPNGCGKSNLVEALRWVMGESSYKNLRGSGMDDVIFSGSGTRPARNIAEVVLGIDNSARTAPAAFNDHEALEISRKIERESGSTYRANGKEVRARDVQILFADAATGSRSSALVRQGQIGELISAKPQARRRIIEDAAGIAGLHSRRHEAELRLKASEANLERLSDVIAQVAGQLDGLRRQARQAAKFKEISAEIRRAEAIAYHLRWQNVSEALEEDRRALDAVVRLVAERTTAVSEANKQNAIAASELPDLRNAEAEAAARLMTLTNARAALDAEEKRIAARAEELDRVLAQIAADLEREESLDREVAPMLQRLDGEEAELKAADSGSEDRIAEARAALEAAVQALHAEERALSDLLDMAAEARAVRAQIERTITDETARCDKIVGQLQTAEAERAAMAPAGEDALPRLAAAETDAQSALEAAEADLTRLTEAVEAAEAGFSAAKSARDTARNEKSVLTAEAKTLEGVLSPGGAAEFPAVVDRITADPGYETALGAALGDDLDHSDDPAAPIRWAGAEAAGDPALPEGAVPLIDHVRAPDVLHRRLRQVGIVSPDAGPALARMLKPGQRLVTKDGALWRWDGLSADADAPTPAAKRLAQRNRLDELKIRIATAETGFAPLEDAVATTETALRDARGTLQAARQGIHEKRRALDAAREAVRRAEREQAQAALRVSALDEAISRLKQAHAESEAALAKARDRFAAAAPVDTHEDAIAERRSAVADARSAVSETQAAADSLTRDADARHKRLKAISDERAAWQRRISSAAEQVARLGERRAAAVAEKDSLDGLPGEIVEKRRSLSIEIDTAETARKAAADKLAEAENRQREFDRAEREAQAALSEAREKKASAEARLDAATARRDELARQIEDALDTQPHAILAMAGLTSSDDLPPLTRIEADLDRLKRDRERLGGVNLRAEEEAREVAEQHDTMVTERDDVERAIRKLRGAIGNLNREGRERLLAAFDTVNENFKTLFTLLFGGGTAELQLIESDDPLEAGLEIIARPPGKKPQTLTLLSGGEQALTAIALIFAVFLTNPSPICVLDEVDAPLDDANVERYCDLLDQMARSTTTRFLVITHNPVTMARMNRLYGVTMAERGVSQLVSVDLETAESFREAV
ncbi:MAG: AAA family ATPase [Rhodobiaceae bacterium]|nr:AAA family ATPase [Rhodobiaceae bacterium]